MFPTCLRLPWSFHFPGFTTTGMSMGVGGSYRVEKARFALAIGHDLEKASKGSRFATRGFVFL